MINKIIKHLQILSENFQSSENLNTVTLITMTEIFPKDVAIKMNLLL